ncbi:MAG: aldo/keto reductase [Acidobacteriia bacterium]|nr:aldo/keto reductase [Terriglobia bacterium]
MPNRSSRRAFLASGLALPVAASAAPAQSMTFGVLGKTGLKVSRLGIGGNVASDPSVLLLAYDLGVNLFDTARSYNSGNSERVLGSLFKDKRKNVLFQTKTTARTKDEALRDLETSLRDLATDYIDIWHLHGRNTPAEVNDGLFEAQRLARQQGKIRFAGVSMHFTMKDMIPYLVKLGQTDVILTSYNFSMPPEMEMEKHIAAARAAGLGIVAMKTMAGGFARIQRGDRLYTDNPQALTARLKQPGAMAAALKWALRNKSVDTAIVAVTDREQLEENVAATPAPLTDADLGLLAAQLDFIRPLYCRMCGECTGRCPQGLPVGDMLRILSYADGYGSLPLARERFRELPERVRQVRCADCASCAVACPHGVRVASRLRKAQQLLG